MSALLFRTNSISANLSVSNHTVPHLHHKLTNLHNLAPLFWLSGVRYKLVQVIHDKNQHLFVRNDGKVRKLIDIIISLKDNTFLFESEEE